MAYWFFNTDKAARGDARTCDLWFEHGLAFSGGDWEKYAKPLEKLNLRDHCLMYHNGLGIVGVGRVIEKWDHKRYSDKLLYNDDSFSEYRLRVDWYLDLRTNPLDPQTEFGYGPPSKFLQQIVNDETVVAMLVSRLLCQKEFSSPDEIGPPSGISEGGVTTVTVDVHERNRTARSQCIERWGTSCVVCGFAFSNLYGPLGDGYIHIHHLQPIGVTSEAHFVDPINDLRPVCPNCHAMLHKKNPPYSIEELKGFVTKKETL
jgi:hypothetical protein